MFDSLTKKTAQPLRVGVIPYGRTKRDDSDDHRTNRGGDRNAAQREGDLKRTRDDSGK
ncbi:hypothetical protein [Paraburkholderia sp. RL17-347-BIC-D]|uniref:hypothetical protein n=1 Tax=Paraburkholderia sp. RL17-347-BIC-D TaxID=3031632 RepID=UPI0038B74343